MANVSNNTATTATQEVAPFFPKAAGVPEPKPMRTWVTDVIGIIGGLQPRDTWHTPKDTDFKVPDTWACPVMPLEVREGKYVFASKEPVWFNWHTFSTDGKTIAAWDRFDERIDLTYCYQNRVPLHVWTDDRNRQHLEPAPGIDWSQCHKTQA